MLTSSLRFLQRNSLRIGAVLGTFVLVAAFILVQQVREASAEQDFHAARAQAIAAQARASELGLENSEFSDLQRQELTTASETPPTASAPFNEERIAFFSRAAGQETQIKDQLETRVQKLLVETRDSAQSAVKQLSSGLMFGRWRCRNQARIATAPPPAAQLARMRRATALWRILRRRTLRKLARQELTPLPIATRAVLDRVIAGEYAMGIEMVNAHVAISRALGAPVAWVPLDAVTTTLQVAGVTTGAPHPNAGRLFLDFITSRAGQEIFREANYIPMRPDVPAKDPAMKAEQGGYKSIVLSPEEVDTNATRYQMIYQEIFR